MSAINKIVTSVSIFFIHVLLFLYAWLISFLTTSIPVVIVCSILSALNKLPVSVLNKFWLYFLLATIPLTVIYFIWMEVGKFKNDNYFIYDGARDER